MEIQLQQIKQHEADRLARSLLESAARAFENPELQAEFEAWKARKAKEAVKHGAH